MEDSKIWLFIGVAIGAIMVYVLIMIFFPEWVGITGKVALEAERSHQEGSNATDDDLTAKLQERKRSTDTAQPPLGSDGKGPKS